MKHHKLRLEEFQLLRDFICQTLGIYFEDDKMWQLESKLNRLMERHQFKSFFEYYNFLAHRFYLNQITTDPEIIELISAITNNETYFNREFGALDTLIDHILPGLTQKGEKICLLCAGCSTGEEPYSVAIALLQSGKVFAHTQIAIIGIDIDAKVLNAARQGAYKFNAFRAFQDTLQLAGYQKFFVYDAVDKIYLVRPMVRKWVMFHQVNMLDLPRLQGLGQFDAIFCRNVLIYFSEEARLSVLDNFARILKAGGYLFLGHSESIIGKTELFVPVHDPGAVYYQKK